jgi:hypothetical protein
MSPGLTGDEAPKPEPEAAEFSGQLSARPTFSHPGPRAPQAHRVIRDQAQEWWRVRVTLRAASGHVRPLCRLPLLRKST